MGEREAARQYLLAQSRSLTEEVRAFTRSSLIARLTEARHLQFKSHADTMTSADYALLSEIVVFLDERNLRFTRTVLWAETGVNLDHLKPLKTRKGAENGTQTDSRLDSFRLPGGEQLHSQLERREKILDLEQQELRVREAALQREKEKLEISRQKVEDWRRAETERFARELETVKKNLASELENERENLISERLKLAAEVARIQKIFPNK